MADKAEFIPVARKELEHIRSELGRLLTALNEFSKERPHIALLERRVKTLLTLPGDEEMTPIRPPSTAALEAFRSSVEFADGTKRPPAK